MKWGFVLFFFPAAKTVLIACAPGLYLGAPNLSD